MTQDTNTASGAADMLELIEAYAEARQRQGHSSYNAQTSAALQAVKDALAASQATAAQPGVVYAELPVPNYPKSGGFPGTFAEAQMRAFADATHAIRASHGEAPASVLHLVHSAFAEIAMAFPKAFALHKVGIADTAVREALAAPATAQADSVPAVSDLPPLPAPDLRDVGTKPQEIKEFLKGYATEYARTAIAARAPADSVQEDAARYRWLREGNDAKHGAAWHVAVNLYGCEWDAAIDAARKQGGAV